MAENLYAKIQKDIYSVKLYASKWSKTGVNAQILQTKLNELYGENKQMKLHTDENDQKAKALKIINLENVDITNTNTYLPSSDINKIAKETHESLEHKNKILGATILQRLKNAQDKLNEITAKLDEAVIKGNAKKAESEAARAETEIKKAYNDFIELAKSIKTQYGINDNNAWYKFDENKGLKKQVADLDKLYSELIYETAVDNNIIGKVGELGAAAYTQAALKRIFGEKSNFGINYTAGEEYVSERKNNPSRKSEFDGLKIQANGGPGINYKITLDPFHSRQGKADIIIDMKTDNKLRISVKNWSGLSSSRDFGENNLANVLLRTPPAGAAIRYIQAFLTNNKDPNGTNLISSAHFLAKISILFDVLMGVSQKDNSSNMIIIIDRSDKINPFQVISIRDIINKVFNNSNFTLSTYPGDKIQKTIQEGNKNDKYEYMVTRRVQVKKKVNGKTETSYETRNLTISFDDNDKDISEDYKTYSKYIAYLANLKVTVKYSDLTALGIEKVTKT